MQVSLLQMQPFSYDKVKNLAVVERAARAAAEAGSALLVAPELCLTGYAVWDRMRALAEPRDGALAEALLEMARRFGIAVAAGMPELDGEAVFNTALCALPSGVLHGYRKCHLFGPDEKRMFKKGNAPSPLFEIGGMQAGMLICYDVEFPEWVRVLALQGVELVIVPTALPRAVTNDRVSRLMVPARALENQVTLVYAGLCGEEVGMAYQGGSCIIGPDGAELARAGMGEALLTARLEVGGAGDPYLADRAPELYGALVAGR